MLRSSAVRGLIVTLAWLILGGSILACTLAIFFVNTPLKESHEYQTGVKYRLQERDELGFEEYLNVNQQTFTLTVVQHQDETSWYETIYTELINTHEGDGQLSVKNIHASSSPAVAPEKKSPDFFAREQYLSQPGTILNYSVLKGGTPDVFCFYIYELNRLRCFGK
ncbi:hypothetical protein ACIOZM_26370 [Pseudomonas sp. NPDC087346]|uniref:hypothetical protein n=1 Tax=Pseudomonas sp. NPDC087346 TaxID=3364438 RepID=UPI003804065B